MQDKTVIDFTEYIVFLFYKIQSAWYMYTRTPTHTQRDTQKSVSITTHSRPDCPLNCKIFIKFSII